MHVFEHDLADGLFHEAVEVAAHAFAVLAVDILETETADIGRALVHRVRFARPDVLGMTVGIAEVIHVHDERSYHVLHLYVFKHYPVDYCVLTPAAAGLYSESPVGVFKEALADAEIGHPARHFAAQNYGTVAVLEEVVAQRVAVSRRFVRLAHINFARLYGNAVVSDGKSTADYVHLIAALGVEAVGVGAGVGILHLYVEETQIF